LIKAILNKKQYDMFLANDIPDYENLKKRLDNTGYFNKIIVYDALHAQIRYPHTNRLIRILVQRKRNIKSVERVLNIDFHEYDEIYLYHDFSEIGKYLMDKKIPFHLLEDALDYFKYFDKYYKVEQGMFAPHSWQMFLKKYLHIGYLSWGQSPYAVDIEVNRKEGIKIPLDKVFEVPRKELFDMLDNTGKCLVYNTYAVGESVESDYGKSMILFTQPLAKDKFVSSEEEQYQIFELLVQNYKNLGYAITVKPHPRDIVDYTGLVKKYNCILIDKNIPSEILNFNPEAKYDIAISITSTAIEFLEYVKERKYMGFEFIEGYRKKNS